jgi:N-formylglutamate amidohydrolase
MKDVYSIHHPQSPLPLVFDSPHSGHIYPEDFGFACDFSALEHTEDKYVDDLFSAAPDYGATFLCAHFPRCYIDANRAADDIDPDIMDGEWPYGIIKPTSRSDAGIGLIRRLVKPGIPVYNRNLSAQEIRHRIVKYYRPYHKALENLIDDAHYNFGKVWHINCHSMPDSSALPKQPIGLAGHKLRTSDIVLGDRDGTCGDINLTHTLRHFLKDLGYTVTINDPFKGVELVDRYSNPSRGRYSLQIEINKALYMNEHTNEKLKSYNKVKTDIEKMMAFCAEYVGSQLVDMAAD